jgi:hypothetical protein
MASFWRQKKIKLKNSWRQKSGAKFCRLFWRHFVAKNLTPNFVAFFGAILSLFCCLFWRLFWRQILAPKWRRVAMAPFWRQKKKLAPNWRQFVAKIF